MKGAGDAGVEGVGGVVTGSGGGATANEDSDEELAALVSTGAAAGEAFCAAATALLATIEHRLKMGHKVRMPRLAPYQGFCRSLGPFVARAARRAHVFGGLGMVGLNLTACEREYPLEPTFCDHWCHTFVQAGCELSPAACVQECEESKGPAECEAARQTLLQCYQQKPSDSFSCGGSGSLFTVAVRYGACQAERDELYECASPGIGECLTGCRTIRDTLNPEVIARCPLANNSCEELCWSFEQYGGLASDASTVVSQASAVLQLALLCVLGRDDAGLPPALPKD